MRRDDRRLGMPTLVVILVLATAASMPAAQKPTIARNQNHVVLAADDASALQEALDGASSMGLHVLFGSHEGVFLSRAHQIGKRNNRWDASDGRCGHALSLSSGPPAMTVWKTPSGILRSKVSQSSACSRSSPG